MKKLKQKIMTYFALEKGMQIVLFNIIDLAGIIGGFFSLLVSIFIHVPMMQLVAIGMSEVVLLGSFYLVNVRGKRKLGALFVCFVITDVMFPVIFFTGGGVHSGTALWFAMGIIFSFLLLSGWLLWTIVVFDILVMGTCFIVAYLHIDWVTSLADEATVYLDIYQSAVVLGLVVGIINLFQVANFNKLLKKNEEQCVQLEEANRSKTEFISQMSHEIRTPINAILGLNEMIARDTKDKTIRNYSQDILEAGNELLGLVNQLFGLNLEMSQNEEVQFVAPEAKVLIVDDVELNCKVLRGLLRDTMIQTEVVYTGQEAVDLCQKTKFDLILMDHMMPDMDGIDTLIALRENEAGLNQETPVVVVTANALEGMEEKYLATGFAAYVAKPISAERLMEVVQRLLPASMCKTTGVANTISLHNDTDINTIGLHNDIETSGEFVNTPSISLQDYLADYLDVQAGLGYCMEDEAFYTEVVEDYFTNTKLVQMKAFFQEEKWDDYRIIVHALKSTSRTIGANELSEHSKALEFAVKDGDIQYVLDHHEEVYEEYQQLLCDISLAVMAYKKDLEDGKHADAPTIFAAKRPSENAISNAVTNEERIARMTSDSAYKDETFISETFQPSNAKLIVVDDDPFNIKMAEKILGDKYRLDSASNGYEALEKIFATHYDLILLDIHMPKMDGHETLQMIREKPEYDTVPVILLSADNDHEAETKGFDEGANDFIRKPFDHVVLTKRIERLLELSYLQQNLQKEVTKQTAKAESRRIKLEYLSDQLVLSLANTIDAKDKYTNGHSTRVAKYSVMLGKKMGYVEEQLKNLEYIGLLHDVGKIGVPDSIINKESRLTDEEYEIIKQHPVIGHNILNKITEIRDIGIGARWHHERFDGKGYPDKLSGEEIPEIARIICVADAYDAMTSNRSYRDLMPQAKVRDEIEKGMGTQFDPRIAKVMLEIIDEDTEYTLHE